MYKSEEEMAIQFEKFIKKEFGNCYIKECKGLFGRPDFIVYEKNQESTSIISFELKLKNWKKATIQAFRYRSFSDVAYVVLPSTETKFINYTSHFFKQYNIGLAEFDKECNFRIIHKPNVEEPYSQQLKQKLHNTLENCRKKTRNIDQLLP